MNGNFVKRTSLGLDENIEGALCYALGFVTGIVFLILEKDNRFVKFHAIQSIATFFPLMIIGWIISSLMSVSLSMMWMVGMLSSILFLIELIIWLVLMLKAFQGEMFKLPIVGDIAKAQLDKM